MKIKKFSIGGKITRKKPSKFGDLSYIGDELELIEIRNKIIYVKAMSGVFEGETIEFEMHSWSKGWAYYVDSEINQNINELTKEMKLLTLSEFITNEANKILNRDKGFMTKEESLRASVDVIFAYNHLLKKPLTLSMFVPCKDGKPLEKPENYSFFETYTVSHLPKQKPSYYKACHAYQEAEKAVIFEGFEMVKTAETFYIESKHYGLDWYGKNDNARLYPKEGKTFGGLISDNIVTVSDLAEATKDNPIILKVKK